MTHAEDTPSLPIPVRRRWLCIAYAFPPIRRSGTHRTLGFVRHLSEWGWEATVLTVEPGDEPIDDQLLREVPSSTRIVRTGWIDWVAALKRRFTMGAGRTRRRSSTITARIATALPAQEPRASACGSYGAIRTPPNASRTLRDWVSRFLQTPDSRLGWLVPAVRAGIRAARQDRAEVIYSTSPYATAHLIAMVVASWTRKPWIADFRDPWVDNPFRDLPRASLRRWDAFLELRVLRRASRIVCATPTMTARLIERYPKLRGKCTTILNGFDAARFANPMPLRDEDRDACVLVHAGQFYGSRSPVAWFRAVRAANGSGFGGRPIRLHLIGPSHYDGRSLSELAHEAGAGSAVRVLGERSHAETLARIAGADGVLLPTASGEGAHLQVPNKLFEYLALRRPILAAADSASPVRTVLRDACADAAVVDPDDTDAMAAAMIRLSGQGAFEGSDAGSNGDAWSNVDAFSRVHRAGELLELFEELSSNAARIDPRVLGIAEKNVARAARLHRDSDSTPGRRVDLPARTHAHRAGRTMGSVAIMDQNGRAVRPPPSQ